MASLLLPAGTRLDFANRPPAPAGDPVDVLRMPLGLGIPVWNAMQERGFVLPVLCCGVHQVMLTAVAPGTASWWRAPHSSCRPGARWGCTESLYESRHCADGVLVEPWDARSAGGPAHGRAVDTAWARELYDLLSRTRSHLRHRPGPYVQQPAPAADFPRLVSDSPF